MGDSEHRRRGRAKLPNLSGWPNGQAIFGRQNPEHHGYYADFRHYPWSSYQESLSGKAGVIDRDKVFGWFGDKGHFFLSHNQFMNMDQLEERLNEE